MKFLFRRKKENITVLEISKHWLKIVQRDMSTKERKINKIIVKEIVSLSDKAVIEEIRNLSKEAKLDFGSFIVSVPHYVAAIRNLDIPSIDFTEIKDIVELQVGKLTPFVKDEIVYDYQILESNAEGYSRVVVVIVQKDIIERYFRILEGAGFKIKRIGLSSEGLACWHYFTCKQEAVDEPYILVDVDYETSDFEVILKDKLIFSRNISQGSLQFLDNPAQWQEKFIGEVNNSIYAYQNEMIGREISKIVISGAENFTQQIDRDFLREKLSLPVEAAPPFKNIPITEEFLRQYNSSIAVKNLSIFSLLGSALASKEQKFDLIPQQVKIEKAVKERGRDLYFLGVCLAVILVIISSIFLGKIYRKEWYLNQLTKEISKIQKKTDKLEDVIGETQIVAERIRKRNLSLDFIYEISKVIPPEIHLLAVNFDGKSQITIRGSSTSRQEIAKFRKVLEDSKYFRNVQRKYATSHKTKDKELTNFEIVCPLEKK